MKKKIHTRLSKAGDKVIEKTWVQRAARLGFVARGLVYTLLGILGLQLAIGWRTDSVTFNDALLTIRGQPFGIILLVLTTVGMFFYSMWGILRAVLNVLNEKENFIGLVKRLGYLASAVSSVFLAWSGWSILRNETLNSSGDPSGLAKRAFLIPFGRELLIIVGISWVASFIGQIFLILKGNFTANLHLKKSGGLKQNSAIVLGKVGLISRSVLLGLIGLFIVYAGWTLDSSKALGMGNILLFFNRHQFGPIVVGVMSIGLICLGLFSLFQSRYLKFSQS